MAENKRVTMKPRVSDATAKKIAAAETKSKSTEVKKDADK